MPIGNEVRKHGTPESPTPRERGNAQIFPLIICIASVFVYRSHLFHLIICEGKIPDACIFYDVLFVGAAGDCDVAACRYVVRYRELHEVTFGKLAEIYCASLRKAETR